MSALDLAAPRFPGVAPDAGQYESYYLTAHAPEGGRAIWIRYTVHQRPGHQPTASLWCTYFDAARERPLAGKATFTSGELTEPPGGFIRIDGAELSRHRATGILRSPTLAASWDLTITPTEPELRHLPADWMYTAPLPRTKTLTPLPAALFTGTLTLDGHEIACEDWSGVVGHNWGGEHAERWIWLHCGAFAGHDEHTWLDLTFARLNVGGITLPWLASGAVSVDGARHALGGPQRARGTLVDESPEGARVVATGPDGVRIEAGVIAPPDQIVVWRYAGPDLEERHSAHCSIADITVHVRRPGDVYAVLHGRATATYELGMHPRRARFDVQPYADGVPA